MKTSKKKNSKVLVLEPDDQLALSIREALEMAAPKALVEMARTLEEAQQLVLGVKPDLFVLKYPWPFMTQRALPRERRLSEQGWKPACTDGSDASGSPEGSTG